VTLATSATLHVTGLFDLASVIDNFGPLMSVAIIVGFAVSTIVFIGSKAFHWGGKPLRLSGSLPYDFFMGCASPAASRIVGSPSG
jgi:delta24(24(1))-sterol reductase